jgi:putative PIN family toxin of toxin-antitoxin system
VTLHAVVDTNVLVSRLGWQGPPASVVHAALRGRIQAVTSQELLDELRRVLEYPRLLSVLRIAGLTAAEVVELVTEVSIVWCGHAVARGRPRRPLPRRVNCVCVAELRGDDVDGLILPTPLIAPDLLTARYRHQIRVLSTPVLWSMLVAASDASRMTLGVQADASVARTDCQGTTPPSTQQ